MVLWSFTALCPKALALASRTGLMGGVVRPAVVTARLHARWILPHSDWSSRVATPEAQKAPHLTVAFSALKEPATKNESSNGDNLRECPVARNCGAALLGVLRNCARSTAGRKPPPNKPDREYKAVAH